MLRHLTFISRDLDANDKVMLCFMPPTPELWNKAFPIAWKVGGVAADSTRLMFQATWSSDYGFSTGEISPKKLIELDGYIPVPNGHKTTLLLDSNQNPPVHHWTDPEPMPGLTGIMAVNGADDKVLPANIALAFINELNTDEEDVFPTLMYPEVPTGDTITPDLTPILKAYIGPNYKENQMLSSDILNAPVWTADLRTLRPRTTIVITKGGPNGYIAEVLVTELANDADGKEGSEPAAGSDEKPTIRGDVKPNGAETQDQVKTGTENDIGDPDTILPGIIERAYSAVLAFNLKNSSEIVRVLHPVVKYLIDGGYKTKVIIKDGDTDAHVDLMLPSFASCAQAEKDVLYIINGRAFPARVAIKGRSGAYRIIDSSTDTNVFWKEINPASDDWQSSGTVPHAVGASIASKEV